MLPSEWTDWIEVTIDEAPDVWVHNDDIDLGSGQKLRISRLYAKNDLEDVGAQVIDADS